ncbi:hypothetical protein N665_1063s0006 [Sinapis alba]|nr:hypothetical protein N665_1063s0006 [Sinapis alba]
MICTNLDQTLVNDNWITKFTQTYSVFEPGGCSDHLRCRFVIQEQQLKPRVGDLEHADILDEFPFESGSLLDRYLGLLLMTKRMTVSYYMPLLDRIRTAQQLSSAGHLQLLGSVIHSTTNFWMYVFRLPKQCISEIEKFCSAFLWVCPGPQPKQSKDTMEGYFQTQGRRELAWKFSRTEVVDESTVSFWYDNWSQLERLVDITGIRGCLDMGIPIDATVERAVHQHRERCHRSTNLVLISTKLQQLQMAGLANKNDEGGKSDLGIHEGENPKSAWSKGIWFSLTTPKFSVVVWIAVHKRLATGDRIQLWNPQADATCVICKAQNETRNHLFFGCFYSETVWKKLTMKLMGTRYSSDWDHAHQRTTDTILDCNILFLFHFSFHSAIYSLWRERNNRRHSQPPREPTLIARYIDTHIRPD